MNANSNQTSATAKAAKTYLLQEKRGVLYETIAEIKSLQPGETLKQANKSLEACRPIRKIILA